MNILFIFNSENKKSLENWARLKGNLLKYITESKFKLIEKSSMLISLDKINYHFFDIGVRNLTKFIKQKEEQEIKFDYIYISDIGKSNSEQFFILIDNPQHIYYNPNIEAYHLFQHYKDTFDKVTVYYLRGKIIEIDTILSYEFDSKTHFKTKEEANERLKINSINYIANCKRQIEFYQNELEKEKKFLKKL